jgi:excisionase family DNA binding protein
VYAWETVACHQRSTSPDARLFLSQLSPKGDKNPLNVKSYSKSSKPKRLKTARWQRIAMMDKEILDVEGAATLLGVSTTTIYNLARKGDIPATRVGREWRFARANLIAWVANGSAADQLSVALSRGRVAKKK